MKLSCLLFLALAETVFSETLHEDDHSHVRKLNHHRHHHHQHTEQRDYVTKVISTTGKNGQGLGLTKRSNGSIDVTGPHGMTAKGTRPGNGKNHVITLNLSPGNVIQIRSNLDDQELEFTKLGIDKGNTLTEEDRAFLEEVASLLEDTDNIDCDTISMYSTCAQLNRAAELMSTWPYSLDIDFIFDKEQEMDRMERRHQQDLDHPVPPDAPAVPGFDVRRNLKAQRRHPIEVDEHGRRRLAYTSLCDQYGTYVAATHDCWSYDRWDEETSFFAMVAQKGSAPCDGGTYFWRNGEWECTQPDHDPSIEYSYGGCFGRCGAGCGKGEKTQYTYDCLDHDSCVRFGHSIVSLWCDDEFATCLDDAMWAPNCNIDVEVDTTVGGAN